MKATSKGLCECFERMVDSHASVNDDSFVGQIILFALGIDAICIGFCKCKSGGYNLVWGLNGDEYIHTFSAKEIEDALNKCNFEYSISVTRR